MNRQQYYSTTCMPFGKFKGQALEEVPTDYLSWLLSSVELRPWLHSAVTQELQRRERGHVGAQSLAPVGVSLQVATRVIAAGRRNLAKAAHPDHGGDTESMTAINSTCDWLERQVEMLLRGPR